MTRVVILNACVILILGLLSIDLYNPALPAMVRALGISSAQGQSLVGYYLIGFSLSQLIYGPLSDRKGRVPVVLLSLGLAAIANYLTFLADSFTAVVYSRLLTGLAAGGCPVISRAILSDTLKSKVEISRTSSIFSMAAQISPGIAPIIGGYITAYLPWNYNFLALSIFMLAGWVFIRLTLQETAPLRENMLPPKHLSNFLILLSNTEFLVYSLVAALVFSITVGYFTASPFVFQVEYHLLPKENGFLFFIYSLGIVAGAYLTRLLLKSISPEKILLYSLLFLLMVSLAFPVTVWLLQLHQIGLLLVYSLLIALGCGLAAPVSMGLSLHGHASVAGTRSALQGTIKMAGSGIILYFFAQAKTSSFMGLMWGLFALALVALIATLCLQIKNIFSK